MLAGVRQTDLENNGLSQGQGVSNESVQATLAEITCPPLKGEPLAVSLEADCDPRLEHMSGGHPTRWISVLIRRRSSHYQECRITT